MYVIGLDIGTSGVKSTVFDYNANVVAHAYEEYDLICESKGNFELNPKILRQSSFEVIKRSVANCKKEDVKAICITSFGESFVCLDKNDNVLSNTMIYMDKRGSEQCKELDKLYGEEKIFDITGHFLDPMFSVYKMRWMHKHMQNIMEKVSKICMIADYIAYCFGADHVCDYSLAARTSMFDIRKKQWWDKGVEFSLFGKDVLPTPVKTGSVIGKLSQKAANELNLTKDVKIIIGGHDQILAAVGGGAYKGGDIVNGMGTVDCLIAVLNEQHLSNEYLKYNFPIIPYVEDNKYVTYAFNMSGGCVVKWFRDTYAKDLTKDAYNILNMEAPKVPTNITVIPYLAGAGTPTMDASTPAIMAGMRYATSRGELFRAFLEGESFEMKINIECFEKMGVDISRVITVGGGTNSDLWMSLRADIFGYPVQIPQNKEAGTLGSAMLCYTNIGIYDSVKQAQEALVKINKVFTPNEENVKIYKECYAKYNKIYNLMKEIYK